jgi:FkbM family methyltransferase
MWSRKARQLLRKAGFSIRRTEHGIGGEPFSDMAYLLGHNRPTIFDVGANVGQSLSTFRTFFPDATIHSFEPSPSTFRTLQASASHLPNVRLWNYGLAASPGQLILHENTLPEWSSLLPLGESGWGSVTRDTPVSLHTVDNFCRDQGIDRIDILKSDTQGYELEVFRGAERMFRQNAVGMVYCELCFSKLYEHMPRFTEVYDFLVSHDFQLVSFYEIAYQKGLASWTDGLFLHKTHAPR